MTTHNHLVPRGVALAAGAIAWAIAHRLHLNERVRPASGALEGFAGWLLFLVLLQWSALAHALHAVLVDWGRYTQHASASPYTRLGILTAVAVDWLVLLLVLLSTLMMHRKSRLFPRLFRLEMLALLAVPLVLALAVTWQSEEAQVPAAVAIVFWVRAALLAPAAGAGFVYSLRSRRFANTFVR